MKTTTLFTVALLAAQASAADLLVPQQHGTIQEAVNAASEGDRVLVSAGTYHEQVNLSGKGISLIGVDGAAATAIDGDNIRTVIVGNGEPSTCQVHGFTIRNGRDYGYNNGGGVRIYNSSAAFTNCHFVSNRADEPGWWGGGAWLSQYGYPSISNCVFYGNYGGGRVAGVYHYLGGGITISDCVFQDNTSKAGICIHVQTEGGTISSSIQRCTFRRFVSNDAINGCVAVDFWNPYGGSISCLISDCVAEEPIAPINAPASMVAFVMLGAFSNSTYNISLTNNKTCGLPNLVYQDANSTWSDGGGNILQPNCCPSDLNDDGDVDGIDLGILLSEWGICPGCRADITGDGEVDGTVDGGDLGLLLSSWGPCP
jgi:hypothetical protein